MRVYPDKVGSSEQAFRKVLSEGLLDKYTSGLPDQKKKRLVEETVNTLCLELERFLTDTQNVTVDQISGRIQAKLKSLGLNKVVFSDEALQQISQALGGDQLQDFIQAFASINIEEKLDGLKKFFTLKESGAAEQGSLEESSSEGKSGMAVMPVTDEDEELDEKKFERLSREILDSDKKEFVKYCDEVLKNMVFFDGMLDRIYDNTLACVKPLLKIDKALIASTIMLAVVQVFLQGSVAVLAVANFQLGASYRYLTLSNIALSAANAILTVANYTLSAANFVHAASVLILSASKLIVAAANVFTLVSLVSAMLSVILSLIISAVGIVISVIATAITIVASLALSAISIAASLIAFAVGVLASILVLQIQALAMAAIAALFIILMVTQVGVMLLAMAVATALSVIASLFMMVLAIVGIGGLIGVAIGAVALALALVASILILAAAVLFSALSIVAVAIVIALMFLEVVALIAVTALFAGACVLTIVTITAAIMAAIGLVTLAVLALELVLLFSLVLLALAIAGGLKFVMDKVKAWWDKLGLAPFIKTFKEWWEGSQIKAWIEELLKGIQEAGGIKEYFHKFMEEFVKEDENGKFIYDMIEGIKTHGGVWNYFNAKYNLNDLISNVWGNIKEILEDSILNLLFGISEKTPQSGSKNIAVEGFNPGSVTTPALNGVNGAQPQFNTPALDEVKTMSVDVGDKGDLIDMQEAKASMDGAEEAMSASDDQLVQAQSDIASQAQAYHEQQYKEEEERSQSMEEINSGLSELDQEMHKQQEETVMSSMAGGAAGGATGGAAGAYQDSNSLCHENR